MASGSSGAGRDPRLNETLGKTLVTACGKVTGLPDPAATARLLPGNYVSLRTMAGPASDQANDVTVYLVEEDFGRNGRAYLETDTAAADRETIIRDFISGQYETPVRVLSH